MATGDRIRNRLQDFRPDTRNLLVAGVVVAVATFALGFGLTALNFMRSGAPIDVVTVPDVREMLVEDASRTLDRSELSIEVGDSFPNPNAPRGAVLAQSPLPGQEVSPGTDVRVIISEGQAMPPVPDVSALPLALATQTLQATGFNVVVEDAPGEGAVGDVVGTIPGPGTALALRGTVRLRIGAPALPVLVPMLIGMTETDARHMAESAGLSVDEITYVGGDEGEPDQVVVGQEPPGGEQVPRDIGLRLRVRGEAPDDGTGLPGPRGLDEFDDDEDEGDRVSQQGRDL